MSSGEGKSVCVTGASGYIASCLVKHLLLRGYDVKASVRDPGDPRKTQHLLALEGAKERLTLFKANLLEEGSYDSVVEGCEGVFHTASPFYHDVTDPKVRGMRYGAGQQSLIYSFAAHGTVILAEYTEFSGNFSTKAAQRLEKLHAHASSNRFTYNCDAHTFNYLVYNGFKLLDPAVKGTLNVLNSCVKAPSVKRVILTSSIAAVTYTGKPRTPDVVVDETWFTDPDYCRSLKLWYVVSKTVAEESAWKFAKEKDLDMVVINPAMVIGPLLQPTLNTSAAAVLSLIKGAHTFPNVTFGWVNVKDVAEAHIQAFEIPSASGRYCLVERVAHCSEVVKILIELYPFFQLPEECADDKPYVPTYQVSREKAKSLGIEFTPLDVSLKETVESLKEKGFVSFDQ